MPLSLAAVLEDMVSGPALFAAAGVIGGDLLPAPQPHSEAGTDVALSPTELVMHSGVASSLR